MTKKRLKILFATIPQPKNRFVSDLKDGIGKHADVVHDYEAFWKCDQDFDIIHIHEPEYLSYEIEGCMNHTDPMPKNLWKRLIQSLEYWKTHSKIVHTRHVQEPHVRIDDEFKKLYETVFSHCDAVTHFANYSIRQFQEFYPNFKRVVHHVIPHQNYTSLPNNVTKKEARETLNIDANAKVMLVFGMIKEREKHLITTAFESIPHKNKVLLAPGWKTQRRPIKWIRLREWVYRWDLWKAKKNDTFLTNLGFIKESDAQYYLKATDVLLIPRIDELNSGNITLGFTFGLVVLGRDGGDIGEILRETGNPVFDPSSSQSITQSVIEALELISKKHGLKNQKLAIDDWGIERISKLYLDFYNRL
jgi:hypothetical protein